ncbi:Lclat1 [Symbiodinium natans]|uniref:Lclat1 protein n=1 Tax=Symbiodinium natans TaxID=878477 RepID=A0A812P7B3_9DINO|nr:Lclat1 [Symbiodinium natans]
MLKKRACRFTPRVLHPRTAGFVAAWEALQDAAKELQSKPPVLVDVTMAYVAPVSANLPDEDTLVMECRASAMAGLRLESLSWICWQQQAEHLQFLQRFRALPAPEGGGEESRVGDNLGQDVEFAKTAMQRLDSTVTRHFSSQRFELVNEPPVQRLIFLDLRARDCERQGMALLIGRNICRQDPKIEATRQAGSAASPGNLTLVSVESREGFAESIGAMFRLRGRKANAIPPVAAAGSFDPAVMAHACQVEADVQNLPSRCLGLAARGHSLKSGGFARWLSRGPNLQSPLCCGCAAAVYVTQQRSELFLLGMGGFNDSLPTTVWLCRVFACTKFCNKTVIGELPGTVRAICDIAERTDRFVLQRHESVAVTIGTAPSITVRRSSERISGSEPPFHQPWTGEGADHNVIPAPRGRQPAAIVCLMFIGMPTRCNISHNLVMYSLRMTRRENEKDGCGAHLLLRRHVCHVAMPLCPDTLMLVDVNSSCIWRPMSFCLPEDAAQDRKGGQRKSRPSSGSACSDDSIATASTCLPDERIAQLRTELSKRTAKLGELETEAAELRSANDLLRTECQRSKCNLDQLLSENDLLRKECHDSNCKLQVEMSLRKMQCRKLRISNKRLREECQDTKQHLKDAVDLNASLQSKLQLAETRLKEKRHLPGGPHRPDDDSTCVPEGDDLFEDSAMSDATPGSSGSSRSSRSSEDPETETTCSSCNTEAAAWEEKYRSIEAALHEARSQLASEQERFADLDSEFGEAAPPPVSWRRRRCAAPSWSRSQARTKLKQSN